MSTDTIAPPAPPVTEYALPDKGSRDPKTKIPSLEITWGDAELLDLSDEGIQKLLAVKRKMPDAKLALIPMRDGQIYVVRRCTRQEWKLTYPKFLASDEEQQRVTAEHSEFTPRGVGIYLQMGSEERIIEKFLVYPTLSLQEVRALDGGDVSCLHESILAAMGFGQPARAVKL